MVLFPLKIFSVVERADTLESCRLALIPGAPFSCVKLINFLKHYGLVSSSIH